jgi:predicted permease
MWIARWLDDFVQDIRYAVRGLSRHPALAAGIILTLAAGIGVNTAIFSVLNGWLFRPLPVPNPEQITVLIPVEKGRRDALESYLNFSDLRAQAADAFSGIFAFAFRIAGLNADGETRQFVASAVSGNYFSVLGIGAAQGRVFVPGEGERAGEELLVVLGHAYWKKNFGGNPAVTGKSVAFNGRQATIIGVAPEHFQGTLFSFPLDGYVTLNALSGEQIFWTDRANRTLNLFGRLKAEVSLRQAQASLDLAAQRLANQYPESNRGVGFRVIRETYARPPLVASFVPVIAGLFLFLPALVLLIACLNVAGIMLARSEARSRELAVRASLGGGRGRLLRQLLTETMLLAMFGAAAGVGFGTFCLDRIGEYLHRLFTSESKYSLSMDAGFDWRVFSYALVIVLGTTLLAGLWPALRGSRTNVNALLNEAGRSASASPRRRWFHGSLVVTQIAGSLFLLIVSALFITSLRQAEKADLGFDPRNVVVLMADPAQLGYDEPRARQLYREMRDRLRTLPGVGSVSMSATVPLAFTTPSAPVYIEGQLPARDSKAPTVFFNRIDEDYLATMRTPLISGRDFTKTDDASRRAVAIVNETMARTFWRGADPVGKRFSIRGANGPFLEVVGVARDGQYRYFTPEPQPYFYIPLAQSETAARSLAIRSNVRAESLMPAIRRIVQQLAPDLLITNFTTMDAITHGLTGLFLPRIAAMLSGLLGLLGLSLAVAGIYGVVSFGVTRRTRELAIRIALGAQRSAVLRLVIGQGSRLVLIGVVCGIAAALLARRGLEKLLIGVSSTDPLVYVVVSLLLAAVALLACYVPARVATKVNPVDSLRAE